jgi:hypothetical protein
MYVFVSTYSIFADLQMVVCSGIKLQWVELQASISTKLYQLLKYTWQAKGKQGKSQILHHCI